MTQVLPKEPIRPPRDIRAKDAALQEAFNLHADATRAMLGQGFFIPRQYIPPAGPRKAAEPVGGMVPVFILRTLGVDQVVMVEVQRLERRIIPDTPWTGRWIATDDDPEFAFPAPHWSHDKYRFISLEYMPEEARIEYANTSIVPRGGHICWMTTYREDSFVIHDMRIHINEVDTISRPGDCVPSEP